MASPVDEKCDFLLLASNPTALKMLASNGVNNPKPEVIIFSDIVIKINRKDKEQTRVLMITNKAVYNLLPNNYGKCKRRIPIENVVSISASTLADEFVLHIPDEYDYRYKTPKKDKVFDVLQKCYRQIIMDAGQQLKDANGVPLPKKLLVRFINENDLKVHTLTKVLARLQTREDVLRRKQQLAATEHDSDKEEEAEAKAQEKEKNITSIMDTNDLVRLEDFELLKVLGRGSFGKVMQVRKKDDGKIYAMKILKKKAIIARNQVEHTKAERKILETLNHPFLMTLRYAFQSKEKLYFVLDYYSGGELFFHLKNNRRFAEPVARIYVAEIALALGHLHSKGIVYRDLKPENILMDENGHVCLTDFGLSKDIDPDEKAQTFCGTPEYLAPEIVTGAGHDKAVDWWGLGILCYELTVGIPPFYSQNVNEMYKKIREGPLRFPTTYPSEDCKNFITLLLHRDPTKRLGSRNDVEDLKAHPFFYGMDWNKLLSKQLDCPYKPKVKGKDDTSNFDSQFTSEPVVDSLANQVHTAMTLAKDSEDANFAGFSYIPKGNGLR